MAASPKTTSCPPGHLPSEGDYYASPPGLYQVVLAAGSKCILVENCYTYYRDEIGLKEFQHDFTFVRAGSLT